MNKLLQSFLPPQSIQANQPGTHQDEQRWLRDCISLKASADQGVVVVGANNLNFAAASVKRRSFDHRLKPRNNPGECKVICAVRRCPEETERRCQRQVEKTDKKSGLIPVFEIFGRSNSAINDQLNEQKLWEIIQFVMKVHKPKMTANEVVTALEREGFKIGGQHHRENVRGAMLRKPDIFQRVSRGMFALLEWPDDLKRSRDQESVAEEPLQAAEG